MDSNNKSSFWTNPNGFSILDLLAMVYTTIFLIMLLIYVKYPIDAIKDVIGNLSPLIYIILSGYFTGQAVQQFKSSNTYSNKQNNASVNVTPITPPSSTNNDININV